MYRCLVLIFVVLFSVSCAKYQVQNDLLAFNKGHNQGNEQVLLANIIRTAQYKHSSFSDADIVGQKLIVLQ